MEASKTREDNRQLASVESTAALAAENVPVAPLREVTRATSAQETGEQPLIAEEPEAPASETEGWVTDAEGDEAGDGFNGPVGVDPSLLGDASDFEDDDSDDISSETGPLLADDLGYAPYFTFENDVPFDIWDSGNSYDIDVGEHEFRGMRATDIDDDDDDDEYDQDEDDEEDEEFETFEGCFQPVPAALMPGSDGGCSVCGDAFSMLTLPIQIHCGHAFCRHCICSWADSCVRAYKAPNCPICRSVLRPIQTPTAEQIASGQWNEHLTFRHAWADAARRDELGFSARVQWDGSSVVRHHREELYAATYMYSSLASSPRGNSATPGGMALLLQAVWRAIEGFEEREASFDEAYGDLLARATAFVEEDSMGGFVVQMVPQTVEVVDDWLATLIVMGLLMAAELARPAGSDVEEAEVEAEGKKGPHRPRAVSFLRTCPT